MAVLTCKNHPHLRWSCKDMAVTDGRYNGSRNIFFRGVPSGRGMHQDGSGLDCTTYPKGGSPVYECDCPASDLIVAPEDVLIDARWRG